MLAAIMLEGLPPNGAATLLRFTCAEHQALMAADLVVDVFDPGETAATAFEGVPAAVGVQPWVVEIYLGGGVAEDDVRALLADVFGGELAAGIETETVAQQDWVTRSLAGLAPVRAGRFLVHGNHDRASVRSNDIALEIEAALAFGTGHHGTTRGCLLALDSILRERRPRRIADLGTGTGVLAMAAAKALRRPVRCGDLDPVAVGAARDNARLNSVSAFVRPVRAAGLQHPDLRRGAPYDLVFANILARPLRLLAHAIGAVVAPRADLILSGLQPRDVPGILASYGGQGFALFRRVDIDGWVTLRLRKR